MRLSSLKRTVSACLVGWALTAPGPATAETGRVVDYLAGSSDEDAADYLAFLIRSFGCVVRPEERREFNAAILDFIALDFGVELSPPAADGSRIVSETLSRSLFAFSYRAGPLLVARGELRIEADGTAVLTTCNALTS
jgi:hypothetical protein